MNLHLFYTIKATILLCSLSALFISCNHPRTNNKTLTELEGKQMISDSTTIEIPQVPSIFSIENINYSDLFTNVRYIPLESNMYSTIGRISKIEITKEKNILVFDDNNYNIVLFDSLGHFLNNIGLRGRGHAEYTFPLDVTYDPFNEQVIVLDNPGYLLYYKMDGSFVSKQKVPWHHGSICALGKDTLAINTNFSDPINSNGVGYNYQILLRNGTPIACYNPYEKKDLYSCKTLYQSFSQNELGCFAHTLNDSHIYSITKNGMSLAYIFKINGQNDLTEEQKEIVKKYMDEDKYNIPNYISNFFKAPNYIFASVSGLRWNLCVYDIRKKVCAVYNSITNDFGGPSSLFFKNVINNEAYMVFEPSAFDFDDSTEHIENERLKALSILKNNDNPIIQVCTIK